MVDKTSFKYFQKKPELDEAKAPKVPAWKRAGPNGELEIKFPTGRRFKIEKHLDENERHKGEWKVLEYKTGGWVDDWEWHDTYKPKGYAKQRVMQMGQYDKKGKKVADYSATFQYESVSHEGDSITEANNAVDNTTLLRFRDMFPMGIEYRPGEDELTNYRALRRKRTIGVGEGGPIGESVKEQENPVDQYTDSGKHNKNVSVGYSFKHKIIKDPTGKHKIKVHQYTSEEVEEEVDEALTVQQRLQRARTIRKNRAKLSIGKKRAARRFASQEVLKKRARKAAYKALYNKLIKNIPRDELSPARKAEIEKRLNKPAMQNKIERMAKKMLKDVRKKEMERKKG